MKPVPRRLVLYWISTIWKSLPKELVTSLLKKYTLTIDDNGEEDEQISCFKPGKLSTEGYKVLKKQMKILRDQQNTDNPFEITESDVENAQFADNIISDDEDDVDIDRKTNQNHKKSSSVDSFAKLCV